MRHDLPHHYDAGGPRNRVQLVLHRSGGIDMVYDYAAIPPACAPTACVAR